MEAAFALKVMREMLMNASSAQDLNAPVALMLTASTPPQPMSYASAIQVITATVTYADPTSVVRITQIANTMLNAGSMLVATSTSVSA